jgi:hypothetical protein
MRGSLLLSLGLVCAPAGAEEPTEGEALPEQLPASEPSEEPVPEPPAVELESTPTPAAASEPSWDSRDGAEPEPVEAPAETPPELHRNLALGAQWFLVEGKLMLGPTLRGGHRWFWVHAETSFVFVTKAADAFGGGLLGSELGIAAALSPIHTEQVELMLGLGGDFYWLYGLHGDLWEAALSTRASGHFWLSRSIGVFGALRVYPAASRGLELGTRRSGEAGMPLLLSLGLEWRPG